MTSIQYLDFGRGQYEKPFRISFINFNSYSLSDYIMLLSKPDLKKKKKNDLNKLNNELESIS